MMDTTAVVAGHAAVLDIFIAGVGMLWSWLPSPSAVGGGGGVFGFWIWRRRWRWREGGADEGVCPLSVEGQGKIGRLSVRLQ